ncbi:hypothetical protein J3R83DRAFT_9264 [Lanmaoa asiatica]|nr:hypothetical protein J3R83DRAFT_9264 [Lanmaoa asiatica]
MSELDEQSAFHGLNTTPKGIPTEGEMIGLDEALTLNEEANIANYLYARFTQLGTLSDLHELLSFQWNSLELRPQGHPHRALLLGSIANSLRARFMQLGMLSNFDEALALEHNALGLRPQGHPDRAVSLCYIANSRSAHFLTLTRHFFLECDTLELHPQGHPSRALSLGNIASCLYAHFNQLVMLSAGTCPRMQRIGNSPRMSPSTSRFTV